MITKVEVRNVAGDLLTLTLDDVTDGYIVEEITGLDPVKATITSSSTALLDGTEYQSSHREARNITMRIGLEPDYVTTSVRDLRMGLYNFFISDSEVDLRIFMADGLIVDISGRVEDCSAVLFTQEPQMNISIMCFKPDFTVLTPTVLSHSTVNDSTEFLLTYAGNAKTGIELVLSVNRTLSAFTVYHRGPDGVTRSMDFAASLVAGDVVTVNTNPRFKAVTLLRSSVLSSILYARSAQSDWTTLSKGSNHLRVYATGAAIPYTITYTTRYGGL